VGHVSVDVGGPAKRVVLDSAVIPNPLGGRLPASVIRPVLRPGYVAFGFFRRSLPPLCSRLKIRRVVIVDARIGVSARRAVSRIGISSTRTRTTSLTPPLLITPPSSLLFGRVSRPADRLTVVAKVQQVFPGAIVLS